MVHSWLGNPNASFANLHLTVWLGPQVKVPHLGIALLLWPEGWFYVDSVSRVNLMADGEYFDRYYEPVNEQWLADRANSEFVPFVSRAGFVRASLVADGVLLLVRAQRARTVDIVRRVAQRPRRPLAAAGSTRPSRCRSRSAPRWPRPTCDAPQHRRARPGQRHGRALLRPGDRPTSSSAACGAATASSPARVAVTGTCRCRRGPLALVGGAASRVREAPFDTAHLRVFYPARPTVATRERLSGVMPADPAGAPYPVAVHRARRQRRPGRLPLARRPGSPRRASSRSPTTGSARSSPGSTASRPGVDLDAARPDAYGTRPTTPSLRPVLDALAKIDRSGRGAARPRPGRADRPLGRRHRRRCSRRGFVPEVKAVATYGAHTMVATMLGWPAGRRCPPRSTAPVLLVDGTDDGVMNGSADRYGEDAATRATRSRAPTTRRSPTATARTCWSRLKGANHFAIVPPGRPHRRAGVPRPARPTTDPAAARALLAELSAPFFRYHLPGRDGRAPMRLGHRPPELVSIRRR